MQKYKELQYIHRLGLPKLKRVQPGYMCSCIKCREGSSPWKTRMYFLTENKEYITVFCQHCGYNTNLRMFLKEFFPFIYEEYVKEELNDKMEGLKNGTLIIKEPKKSKINTCVELKYKFNLNQKYFKPANKYRASVDFCKKRHISEHIDKFYYNIHPTHIMSGMVVFPFLLEDQETLYGLQGRHTEKKLFHTISKNEAMKIYNIFNVNFDKPVYCFESIIDSLMVENAIAMLGTTLSPAISDMIQHKVMITDNDRVGRERTLRYLQEGHECFIFPSNFKYKDFNEAVCDGFKKSDLPKLIENNTFIKEAGIARIKFQLMGKK